MTDPTQRRFCPTPIWLIYGLLVVEGLLWLSEQYGWFNEKKGWTVLIAVAVVGVAMLLMLLWFLASLLFRSRFQFSIRSLLVLTVAIAVPCRWMAVEIKAAREQTAAFAPVKQMGGWVAYDWECEANGDYLLNHLQARDPAPTWLRDLMGDAFFGSPKWVTLDGGHVTDAGLAHIEGLSEILTLSLYDTPITDAGLAHLEGLDQLHSLLLGATHVTDAGLAHLERLSQLRQLSLDSTQVTGSGLPHLAGLHQLQTLMLNVTKVTDTGLAHLAGLRQLQRLWLNKTQVTDAGLAHLTGLSQLKELHLGGTKVTDAGVKKLQRALPSCGVYR